MTQFRFTIAILTAIFMFPMNDASATTCARWVQLNKQPVCFGARDDQYGSFIIDRPIFVISFKLLHRSGKVTCFKTASSFWGCKPNRAGLSVLLTDDRNNILEPVASSVSSKGWYTLPGYTSSSSVLVFSPKKTPLCILRNQELRLWYGEDFRAFTESDNSGKTCADVFALVDE